MTTLALLLSIISSPDVCDVDVQYRGRLSYFEANYASSLINAAKATAIPTHYCACRWNERRLSRALKVPRKELRETLFRSYRVEVMNPNNGRKFVVTPVDTGPNRGTGRAIDLDEGTVIQLGLKTDDEVLFRLVRR